MTADDDRSDDTEDLALDPGLDSQMKQLRNVWVSMRDEEPSNRGLAALMAAAREQADTMKPHESWWQRLFVTLRRPPVLAMATVVVLIGGAMFIAQRRDEMEAKTTAEYAPSSAHYDSAGKEDDTAKQMVVADGVAAGEATLAREKSDSVSATGAGSGTLAEAKPDKRAPRPPRHDPKTAVEKNASPTVVDKPLDSKDTPEEAPVMKPGVIAGPTSTSTTKLEIATGDNDEDAVVDNTRSPKRDPISRKPLPGIEGEDRQDKGTRGGAPGAKAPESASPDANSDTTPQPTIAQLVKQCESAAARGDCAAVRVIAGRIAKQDPAVYKTRVIKNAAVARCLAD